MGGQSVHGARQPLDAAALLIDRHQERSVFGRGGMERTDEGAQLGRAFDVASEEHDAADPGCGDQRLQLVGHARSLEADEEELTRGVRHPPEAPACAFFALARM